MIVTCVTAALLDCDTVNANNMVGPCFYGTVFVRSKSSKRDNDMILWILPIVHGHAVIM